MQAQPEFALAFVPKIVILIGVIVVVGLVAALFSSRSWLGALGAFVALLLVGGAMFVAVAGYFFVGRSVSTRVVTRDSTKPPVPPDAPAMRIESPRSVSAEAPEPIDAERATTNVASPPSGPAKPLSAEAIGTTEPVTPSAATAEAGIVHALGGLPEWAHGGDRLVDGVYRMPVSIGPYPSAADCDREKPQAFADAVKRYANEYLTEGAGERVSIPTAYINQHIYRTTAEEWRETSLGRMVIAHHLLEFDDGVRHHIEDVYRESLVAQRLKYAGLGAAGVFGLLATVFGYLKLDTLSRGYYTGRLRATAVAAILGLVATLVLAAGLLVVA